ncbi:MAG TPA: tetratricopeptide repeat protein [Myxococcaceae bacterium]|nr:tetratricopeptide repeat protein [Myxococcaceae bacterium]
MRNVSNQALQGFRSLQSGQSVDAIRHFQEGLASDPNDEGCLLGMARVRLLEDDARAATSFLQRLVKANPDHSEGHSHLALIRFREGEAYALSNLRRLAAAPDSGVYERLNLGKALSWSGDASGAEAAFQAACAAEPKSPFPRMEAAEAALARGEPAAAVRHLEAAVKLAPNEVVILGMLARAHRETDNLAQAVAVLDRASALAPQDPSILEERYDVAELLGAWKDARAVATRLVKLDGTSADYRYMLARALANDGQPAEARALLEVLAKEQPGSPEVRQVLAEVLGLLGDQAGALKHLEEAVRLEPSDPGPANDLANLYLNQPGGKPKVRKVLEPVLARYPDDAVTHYNLALSLVDSDKAAARLHAEVAERCGDPWLSKEAARLRQALMKG